MQIDKEELSKVKHPEKFIYRVYTLWPYRSCYSEISYIAALNADKATRELIKFKEEDKDNQKDSWGIHLMLKKRTGLENYLIVRSSRKTHIIQGKEILMGRDVNLYSGQYYSKKNNKNIFYESTYEYKAIRLMEDNPYIVKYDRCKLSFPVATNPFASFNPSKNKKREFYYNPDFVVTFANGAEYILEVKAKGLMGDFFVHSKLLAGVELVKYTGLGYMIWTEEELGITITGGGKKRLRDWFFAETGKVRPMKLTPGMDK